MENRRKKTVAQTDSRVQRRKGILIVMKTPREGRIIKILSKNQMVRATVVLKMINYLNNLKVIRAKVGTNQLLVESRMIK